MPIFACRWQGGNISFVAAANREEAEYQLDELGDASGIKLVKVPEFMVHMHLSDTIASLTSESVGFQQQRTGAPRACSSSSNPVTSI